MSLTVGGKTTTNGGTIITIPANSSWRGSIALSAVCDASGTFNPDITVEGATADPPAGTPVLGATVFGAALNLAPMGTSVAINDVIIYAGTSPATLQLNLNSVTAATGSAFGFFQ